MAYDAHTWIHEEVIYAQWLNHAELGIQQNAADIAQEVLDRATAVNNEKNRAQTAEGILDGKISAEQTARSTRDGELTTLINNEVTRATGVEANKVNVTSIGVANGVASLDTNGKVPASQLPSYVDDVIEGYYKTADGKFYEDSSYTTEITGEIGKIYVDLSTDRTYRWSGTVFVEIAATPTILTSTLTAGSTSVTFTDGVIASATFINIMTSSGIAPTAQSVSGSTYTATFEAQSANIDVAIEVK